MDNSKNLKLPKLRLYQQIIIYFIAVVFIPLLGVSFIIYSINQKALKKELIRFTEHTSEAIYSDLMTQFSWQKEQVNLLGTIVLDEYADTKNIGEAARQVFSLEDSFEAIGLYNGEGEALGRSYRNFSRVSPERRLPERLNLEKITQEDREAFQLVFSSTGDPRETTYYLRAIVPVKRRDTSFENISFLVMQKEFAYLQELIHSKNRDLYDGFFIIDNNGLVIAGPNQAVETRQHINPEDFAFFSKLKPGVTREFATPQKTLGDDDDEPDVDNPLQKVFVKIPDLNWGIIIESPYEVRQKYVKRARDQTLMLILACLVIVIVFTLFYILGIHRNFRQLIKGMKAMAEGRYSRRIRLITNWFTPYEIVYITGEFNRMGRKIGDAWQESQQLTDELKTVNQKLAKLDEMKSNLIDTVSHELRTPLTSIKGYSSRLIRYDQTLDRETRIKSLKTIKQQADRLGRLVDDLLAIPELESDNLRVFLDQVNLPDLIDRSVHFIQQKEDREIFVQLPENTEALNVLADQDRLEQILLNLLDNAVKYSRENTPIETVVRFSDEHEGHVEITVINESDPISQEDVESLFEKFKRLDESTTRTTRGTGLGLFITRGLVEAMGGRIGLAYAEDRFQVRFTVPLYKEEGSRTELQETVAAEA